jgi:hypothetical protein
LKTSVRSPSVVADFVEMPLEVRIKNDGPTVGRKIVTVSVKEKNNANERIYVRAGTSNSAEMPFDSPPSVSQQEQNSIAVESIPADGTAILTFLLRMPEGTENSEYIVQVKIDGEAVNEGISLLARFDRAKAFELGVTQHLLFPPGATFVIPLGLLVLVSFAEWVAYVVAQDRGQGCALRESLKRKAMRLAPTGAILLGLGLIAWRSMPVMWSVFALVLVFAVIGLFAGLTAKWLFQEPKVTP